MDALLNKLYKIHSHSGKETEMRNFLLGELKNEEVYGKLSVTTDDKGNILITKGPGDKSHSFYPCVCAHIDQVQTKPLTHVIECDGIVFGYSSKEKSQIGIGADDKNGIWCALKLLSKFNSLKVALFVSEEVGCVGSSGVDLNFFTDVMFAIQADRRGSSDIIFNASGTKIASQQFEDAIKKLYSSRGYKATSGMTTDVWKLSSRGIGVSCCNISCGYYEPHTNTEYTILSELDNCLGLMEEIINKVTFRCPHKSVYTTTYPSTGYTSGYGYTGYSGSQYSSESYTLKWFEDFQKLVYALLSEPYLDTLNMSEYYDKHHLKYGQLFGRDYILAQHDALMLMSGNVGLRENDNSKKEDNGSQQLATISDIAL